VRTYLLLMIALGWALPVCAHVLEQGFVLLLPAKAYRAGGVVAAGLTILLLAFVSAEKSTGLFHHVRLIRAIGSDRLRLDITLNQ
jgi:hypothetical protein